jgi:hypothetical protein
MNLNRTGAGRNLINQVLLTVQPRVKALTKQQLPPNLADQTPNGQQTPRSKFSARK